MTVLFLTESSEITFASDGFKRPLDVNLCPTAYMLTVEHKAMSDAFPW
jgi:hypothetical protein